jgi:hypothetical protein
VRRISQLLIAVLVSLVGVFVLTGSAAGAPPRTTTENLFVPTESGGAPLCGGEEVVWSGTMHILVRNTIDAAGGLHGTFHTNYQRVTITGVTSGTAYHITDQNNFTFTTRSLPAEFTQTINGNILGPGPSNNTGFHLTLHVTINANGTTTADVVEESIRCNG